MEKVTPLVSIIVPVYNVENYLSRCIESIISQTFHDFELILVDDGSPDGSGAMCDDYAQKDHRVRVVHKKNGGISTARNEGLDRARGKYIMFVDSDDELGTSDMIEQNVMLLTNLGEKSFVQFPTLWYWDDSKKTLLGSYTESCTQEQIHAAFFQDKITSIVWDKIYTRDVFNEIRFPVGRYHEDTYTMVDILKTVRQAVLSDKGYYKYIQRQGSVTNSGISPKLVDDFFFTANYVLKFAHQCPSAQTYTVRSMLDMIDRLAYSKHVLSADKYSAYISIIRQNMPRCSSILKYLLQSDSKKGLKLLLINIIGVSNYYRLRSFK